MNIEQAAKAKNQFWKEVYPILQDAGFIETEIVEPLADSPAPTAAQKIESNLPYILLILAIGLALYFLIKYTIRYV